VQDLEDIYRGFIFTLTEYKRKYQKYLAGDDLHNWVRQQVFTDRIFLIIIFFYLLCYDFKTEGCYEKYKNHVMIFGQFIII
jgi:hypothetical protein